MEITNEQRDFALEQSEGHDVIVIAEERDHDAWRQAAAARSTAAGTLQLLTPAQVAAEPTLSFDGRVLIADELDRGVTLPDRSRSGSPVRAILLGAETLLAGAASEQLAERIRRRPERTPVTWFN